MSGNLNRTFRKNLKTFLFLFVLLRFPVKSDPDDTVQTFRVQLDREFVSGLSSDASLCKVFQPPVNRAESFWVGMKPIPEMNPKVRFVVVHRCRKSLSASAFKKFLQKSFDCEDNRFVQVIQLKVDAQLRRPIDRKFDSMQRIFVCKQFFYG